MSACKMFGNNVVMMRRRVMACLTVCAFDLAFHDVASKFLRIKRGPFRGPKNLGEGMDRARSMRVHQKV